MVFGRQYWEIDDVTLLNGCARCVHGALGDSSISVKPNSCVNIGFWNVKDSKARVKDCYIFRSK